MRLRRVICAFALLLAAAVACPPSRPAAAAGDSNAAYKSAHDVFTSLVKDEKKAKYRIYWQELEKQFVAVYTAAPDGHNAAKALFFAGRTNDELGRHSQIKSDFRRAVDYYGRVVVRFPTHNLAGDALLRKAAIEAEFLNEPAKAQADALRVLANYPKGAAAPKAQELLHALAAGDPSDPAATGSQSVRQARAASPRPHDAEAAQEATPLAQGKAAPAEEKILAAQAPANVADKPAPGGLNRLLDVRYQASDEYSRIVLVFDTPAAYRYELLGPNREKNRPHRLYIDLSETVLGAAVKREVSIADGILSQVRLAQNSPRMARVVLDFTALQKYTIFALENPARLIIDVSSPKDAGKPRPEPDVKPEKPAKGPDAARPVQRIPDKAVATTEKKSLHTARAAPLLPERQEPDLDPLDDLSNNVASNDPTIVGTKSKTKDKSKEQPKGKAPSYKLTPEGRKQSHSLVEQLGLTVRTIMIDPGHGGKDPGASGLNGLKEKNVNLKFALALGKRLETMGFRVLYTRTTDKFIHLEDRTAKANVQKADLFISVHCNSFGSATMSGFETYYLDLANSKDAVRVAARENAVTDKSISDLQVILTDLMLNSKLKESKELAKNVHGRAVKAVKPKYAIRDHGVHSAPFYVLMGAKMPAVLMEIGYVTNPADAERLTSAAYLDHLASGLAQGVAAYKKSIERLASL